MRNFISENDIEQAILNKFRAKLYGCAYCKKTTYYFHT